MHSEEDEVERAASNRTKMAKSSSFKMSIKSPLAMKLKSSISRKLLDFIPDYVENDDLAEYVVVLVGNGKDQNQARADLDEFLGERSEEFVTWLWDVISEHVPLSYINERLSIAKDVSMTSSQEAEGGPVLKTNRRKEPRYQGNTSVTGSQSKVEKFDEPSKTRFSHRHSNNVEIFEVNHQLSGSRNSFNELNIAEESLQQYNKKFRREHGSIGSTGGDYQTCKSVSGDQPSMHQLGKKPSFKCSNAAIKVSTVPRREANFRDMPSSYSDIPLSRNSFDVNISGRTLSPKVTDVTLPPINKPRRSVWDRLGRPSENLSVKVNSVYDVDNIEKDEVPEDQIGLYTLPSDECKKSAIEASRLGKRVNLECARMIGTGNIKSSIEADSSNRQKRQFDEVIADAGVGSTSLVGDKGTDHHKENIGKPKVSSLTIEASEDAVSNMGSRCSLMADNAKPIKDGTTVMNPVKCQVIDVKLRLRQVEKEMSDLQKKQEEMKRAAKCRLSFGASRNVEEYFEGTTVLVTNVHFAATKEALLSYFARCGSISNVVILTDPVTAQPKGSACITFTSTDSVDSAVKLTGSSFFSRIIKVFKKDEPDALISAQALAKNPTLVEYFNNKKAVTVSPFHPNSRLQWRRPFLSSPCEIPTATTIEPQPGAVQSSM